MARERDDGRDSIIHTAEEVLSSSEQMQRYPVEIKRGTATFIYFLVDGKLQVYRAATQVYQRPYHPEVTHEESRESLLVAALHDALAQSDSPEESDTVGISLDEFDVAYLTGELLDNASYAREQAKKGNKSIEQTSRMYNQSIAAFLDLNTAFVAAGGPGPEAYRNFNAE